MNRNYLALIKFALCAIIVGGCQVNLENDFKKTLDSAYVISVDDMAVDKEEYMLHLKPEIALTYNYFYLNHDVEPNPIFWTTSYGGIRPIDFIKRKTDSKLKRIKIIQGLASEFKVINTFSYDEFSILWEQKNKDRAFKKSNGEVIYGPVKVGKREYYTYLFTNLEIRLKDKLNRELFQSTTAELREHFEKIKSKHFLYASEASIEILHMDESRISKTSRDAWVENARSSLENGESMTSYASRQTGWTLDTLNLLDSEKAYGEENYKARIKDIVPNLKMGEIRTLSVDFKLYIFQLLSPLKTSFREFEEVKDQVLFDFRDQMYATFIEQRMSQALIVKNDIVYENLLID